MQWYVQMLRGTIVIGWFWWPATSWKSRIPTDGQGLQKGLGPPPSRAYAILSPRPGQHAAYKYFSHTNEPNRILLLRARQVGCLFVARPDHAHAIAHQIFGSLPYAKMSSPLPIQAPKRNTQQQHPQQRPLGSSPAPFAAPPSPFRPRADKKMSVAQTYFLAHKARAKLCSEAARPDHNLRLLVGHANLLDSLMLELADAEREQESWFNQSVRGASHWSSSTTSTSTSTSTSQDRHIQWADTIVEEPEHDWQAEDAESDSDDSSDSDSDFDDEDVEMADAVALRRIHSHALLPKMAAYQYDEDEEDDYDMDNEALRPLICFRGPHLPTVSGR